jgi:hypothetical protein
MNRIKRSVVLSRTVGWGLLAAMALIPAALPAPARANPVASCTTGGTCANGLCTGGTCTADVGTAYARDCYNAGVPLPPTFGSVGNYDNWVYSGPLAATDGNGVTGEGQSFNVNRQVEIFYYYSKNTAPTHGQNGLSDMALPNNINKNGTCMMAIRQGPTQQKCGSSNFNVAEFVGVICQGTNGASCMWTMANNNTFPWGAGGSSYPGVTPASQHVAVPPFTNACYNGGTRSWSTNLRITGWNADTEGAYPGSPAFVGGLHLAGATDGTCTACHAGQNMFINHPGTATDLPNLVPDINNLPNYWFPANWPNPIVPNFDATLPARSGLNYPSSWPVVTSSETEFSQGFCQTSCHFDPSGGAPAGVGGLFPNLSQLTNIATGHDYCSNVLGQAMSRTPNSMGASSGAMPGASVFDQAYGDVLADGSAMGEYGGWQTEYPGSCNDLNWAPLEGHGDLPTFQSSVFTFNGIPLDSHLGQDANTDGTVVGSPQPNPAVSVFHTLNHDSSNFDGLSGGAFWFQDLLTISNIKNVWLYNRTDCCSERLGESGGVRINYYDLSDKAWYARASGGAVNRGISAQESSSGQNVWAIDQTNNVFYWSMATQKFVHFTDLSFTGSQGTIAASGQKGGATPGGNAGVGYATTPVGSFRFTFDLSTGGGTLVQLDDIPLKQIVSPGPDEAWGIDASGLLYQSVSGGAFTRVTAAPASITQIAISPVDGLCETLYLRTSSGALYVCGNEGASFTPVTLPSGKTATSVAVAGASNPPETGGVWITPQSPNTGAYYKPFGSNTWTLHGSSVTLVQLAASDDTNGHAEAWAQDSAGNTYKYYASSGSFTSMNRGLYGVGPQFLSVGGPGEIWAVGNDQNIYNRAAWKNATTSSASTAGKNAIAFGFGPYASSVLNFQTRFIMVQKVNPGTGADGDYLHLAEVQTYGTPATTINGE